MATGRKLEIDGKSVTFEHETGDDGSITLGMGQKKFKVTGISVNGDAVSLKVNGFSYDVVVSQGDRRGDWKVDMDGAARLVKGSSAANAPAAAKPVEKRRSGPAAARGAVSAPMPGKVLSVLVREGAIVAVGEVLLTLEAMKMENRIESPAAGEVTQIKVTAGQAVSKGDVLLVIK